MSLQLPRKNWLCSHAGVPNMVHRWGDCDWPPGINIRLESRFVEIQSGIEVPSPTLIYPRHCSLADRKQCIYAFIVEEINNRTRKENCTATVMPTRDRDTRGFNFPYQKGRQMHGMQKNGM